MNIYIVLYVLHRVVKKAKAAGKDCSSGTRRGRKCCRPSSSSSSWISAPSGTSPWWRKSSSGTLLTGDTSRASDLAVLIQLVGVISHFYHRPALITLKSLLDLKKIFAFPLIMSHQFNKQFNVSTADISSRSHLSISSETIYSNCSYRRDKNSNYLI